MNNRSHGISWQEPDFNSKSWGSEYCESNGNHVYKPKRQNILLKFHTRTMKSKPFAEFTPNRPSHDVCLHISDRASIQRKNLTCEFPWINRRRNPWHLHLNLKLSPRTITELWYFPIYFTLIGFFKSLCQSFPMRFHFNSMITIESNCIKNTIKMVMVA